MEYQLINKQRKEESMRPKMRELHEQPSTEIVKSETVRLTSGVLYVLYSV